MWEGSNDQGSLQSSPLLSSHLNPDRSELNPGEEHPAGGEGLPAAPHSSRGERPAAGHHRHQVGVEGILYLSIIFTLLSPPLIVKGSSVDIFDENVKLYINPNF